MDKTQQDLLMEDQEGIVHNHTVKEALEAKRRLAEQQKEQAEKVREEKPASEKKGKGRPWLKICAIGVAAVLMVLAGMRFLAPGAFYKLFRINPLKTDSVVMTIDAFDISRDEYLSYIVPAKQLLEETYGAEAVAKRDDLLTIVRQSAEESLFGRYTLLKWAAEYGITAESIAEDEFAARKEQIIASYGGKDSYEAAMKQMHTTAAVQDLKIRQDIAIEKLTYALTTGTDPLFTVTDEQVRAYYEQQQLYAVKHVLLLANSYDDATEKLESAKKVLSAAQNGSDFDELVKLYSEDLEKEQHLMGYICQKGEQEPAFEKAALSLDMGEIYPDVVSTSYGFHVLQRIEPGTDLLHDQLDQLIVDDRIIGKRIALQSEMLVHYAPGYENISFSGIDDVLEK